MEKFNAQQIKMGPTKQLFLDQLQAIEMPFYDPIPPMHGKSGRDTFPALPGQDQERAMGTP
jgi:hypothetical protein